MTTTTNERTTRATRIPPAVYAVAGAGEAAYRQLRKLPALAEGLREEIPARVERFREDLPERVATLRTEVPARVDRLRAEVIAEAQEAYRKLVARGEKVVGRRQVKVEVGPTEMLTARKEDGKSATVKTTVATRPARKAGTTRTAAARTAAARKAPARKATSRTATRTRAANK